MPLCGHKGKHDEIRSGAATGNIFSRLSNGGCPCKSTAMCEKHLPTCGACWSFRSTLGERDPEPIWHTGHVFSPSGKQSRFLIEIALKIVATMQ